ncbi:MAG: hypothetical protein IJN03_01475 [Bacilli bacterium]|nr:hypothetical protein [Bacilli bacterium]
MAESLYTIKRDSICVGKVITNFTILDNKHNLLGKPMSLGEYSECRSMLFASNEGGFAEDLLYSTPQYPIFRECNDVVCKQAKFMIIDPVNMGKFLKAVGYEEDVEYLDVERIRNRYFKRFYTTTHAEEFGMTEVDIDIQLANELSQMKNLTEEQIACYKRLRKFQNFFGLRSQYEYSQAIQETPLTEISKFFLPPEYFEILRKYGDRSIFELYFGYADKMNSFKPIKEEGPIRSLKKYN